jgi:beta-galactosidase
MFSCSTRKPLAALLSAAVASLLGAVVASPAQAAADPATSIWIESEKTSSGNLKLAAQGTGNPQFVSGGTWAMVSAEGGEIDKQLPGGSATAVYNFTTKKAGNYELWNRIGFEFVRSPFDFRVDNGAWKTIKSDDLTTDLIPLAEWTEIAWIKMGTAQLSAGAHKLEIRLSKTTNDKGEVQRLLYASDAILISDGAFNPNGA